MESSSMMDIDVEGLSPNSVEYESSDEVFTLTALDISLFGFGFSPVPNYSISFSKNRIEMFFITPGMISDPVTHRLLSLFAHFPVDQIESIQTFDVTRDVYIMQIYLREPMASDIIMSVNRCVKNLPQSTDVSNVINLTIPSRSGAQTACDILSEFYKNTSLVYSIFNQHITMGQASLSKSDMRNLFTRFGSPHEVEGHEEKPSKVPAAGLSLIDILLNQYRGYNGGHTPVYGEQSMLSAVQSLSLVETDPGPTVEDNIIQQDNLVSQSPTQPREESFYADLVNRIKEIDNDPLSIDTTQWKSDRRRLKNPKPEPIDPEFDWQSRSQQPEESIGADCMYNMENRTQEVDNEISIMDVAQYELARNRLKTPKPEPIDPEFSFQSRSHQSEESVGTDHIDSMENHRVQEIANDPSVMDATQYEFDQNRLKTPKPEPADSEFNWSTRSQPSEDSMSADHMTSKENRVQEVMDATLYEFDQNRLKTPKLEPADSEFNWSTRSQPSEDSMSTDHMTSKESEEIDNDPSIMNADAWKYNWRGLKNPKPETFEFFDYPTKRKSESPELRLEPIEVESESVEEVDAREYLLLEERRRLEEDSVEMKLKKRESLAFGVHIIPAYWLPNYIWNAMDQAAMVKAVNYEAVVVDYAVTETKKPKKQKALPTPKPESPEVPVLQRNRSSPMLYQPIEHPIHPSFMEIYHGYVPRSQQPTADWSYSPIAQPVFPCNDSNDINTRSDSNDYVSPSPGLQYALSMGESRDEEQGHSNNASPEIVLLDDDIPETISTPDTITPSTSTPIVEAPVPASTLSTSAAVESEAAPPPPPTSSTPTEPLPLSNQTIKWPDGTVTHLTKNTLEDRFMYKEWVNDEILMFRIAQLRNEYDLQLHIVRFFMSKSSHVMESYAFESMYYLLKNYIQTNISDEDCLFFYKSLYKKGKRKCRAPPTDKTVIMFPIIYFNHWLLLVIQGVQNIIRRDVDSELMPALTCDCPVNTVPEPECPDGVCQMIIIDSLINDPKNRKSIIDIHQELEKIFKLWLRMVMLHDYRKPIDISKINVVRASSFPTQRNGWDCGYYVLRYIEQYMYRDRSWLEKSREKKMNFTELDLTMQDHDEFIQWIEELREEILDAVDRMTNIGLKNYVQYKQNERDRISEAQATVPVTMRAAVANMNQMTIADAVADQAAAPAPANQNTVEAEERDIFT